MKKMFVFLFLIFGMFSIAHEKVNGLIDHKRPVRPENPPFNIGSAIVLTQQIRLEKFPEAYNPSLIEMGENFLLVFRHHPDPKKLWISHIGIVLLNKTFEVISEPSLLKNRKNGAPIPSQAEDARIFSNNGRYYLLYNDNENLECPLISDKRDMYISELTYVDGNFILSDPLMLFHEKKYRTAYWQKNWVPFSWNNTILLGYSLNPHEILYPDFETGSCVPCYKSTARISWPWGELRGGTPALLVGDEYLAFFHSSISNRSISSRGKNMWHYYMGAYTFSAHPPFTITKMTPTPLIGKNFYTNSDFHKRVIFPGGYVYLNSWIYIAYGKDDHEMWIAVIDYKKLQKTLVPVVSQEILNQDAKSS